MNTGKGVAPFLHLGAEAIEKGVFGSPSTTVGQRCLIYIYIYIYKNGGECKEEDKCTHIHFNMKFLAQFFMAFLYFSLIKIKFLHEFISCESKKGNTTCTIFLIFPNSIPFFINFPYYMILLY